ncbi:hypothetical protein Agub_g180, partial [Astrephomene gubernaculifera]
KRRLLSTGIACAVCWLPTYYWASHNHEVSTPVLSLLGLRLPGLPRAIIDSLYLCATLFAGPLLFYLHSLEGPQPPPPSPPPPPPRHTRAAAAAAATREADAAAAAVPVRAYGGHEFDVAAASGELRWRQRQGGDTAVAAAAEVDDGRCAGAEVGGGSGGNSS